MVLGCDRALAQADCRRPLTAVALVGRIISCGIQINQPTRCYSFSGLLLDVYVQVNMFRASSRPSSGAQQLQ